MRLLALTSGIAALLWPAFASAGPLDDVRSEVHGGSSSDSSSDGDDGDDGFDWASNSDYAGCVSCTEGTLVVASPAYLPYPYADGAGGYIASDSPTQNERPYAARLSGESAYQYQGLWRVGLGGRAALHWLEVDSEWSFYRDTRERDSLWIGDANFGFTPLRVGHAVWHVGGGGRFLIDSQPDNEGRTGNAIGWNVTTGVDLFPFDPVTITTEANVGTLGNAVFWRVRGSIGIQLTRAEFFAGYEHFQIGAAPLGGPMIGIRLWL